MRDIGHLAVLEHVYELNRLFLKTIQICTDTEIARIGFPCDFVHALHATKSDLIDLVAMFPRALFHLDLGARLSFSSATPPVLIDMPLTDTWQALTLTVVLSAWRICRDEPFKGRLFFGLSVNEVRALRGMSLSELPAAASSCLRLGCAFRDSPWLWRELLKDQTVERREQLTLVALQPPIEAVREPTRCVAERRVRG